MDLDTPFKEGGQRVSLGGSGCGFTALPAATIAASPQPMQQPPAEHASAMGSQSKGSGVGVQRLQMLAAVEVNEVNSASGSPKAAADAAQGPVLKELPACIAAPTSQLESEANSAASGDYESVVAAPVPAPQQESPAKSVSLPSVVVAVEPLAAHQSPVPAAAGSPVEYKAGGAASENGKSIVAAPVGGKSVSLQKPPAKRAASSPKAPAPGALAARGSEVSAATISGKGSKASSATGRVGDSAVARVKGKSVSACLPEAPGKRVLISTKAVAAAPLAAQGSAVHAAKLEAIFKQYTAAKGGSNVVGDAGVQGSSVQPAESEPQISAKQERQGKVIGSISSGGGKGRKTTAGQGSGGSRAIQKPPLKGPEKHTSSQAPPKPSQQHPPVPLLSLKGLTSKQVPNFYDLFSRSAALVPANLQCSAMTA